MVYKHAKKQVFQKKPTKPQQPIIQQAVEEPYQYTENKTFDIFDSLSSSRKQEALLAEPPSGAFLRISENDVTLVRDGDTLEEFDFTRPNIAKKTPIPVIKEEQVIEPPKAPDNKKQIVALQEDFKKQISQVRRMVAGYSGGGTVAAQYANGGVMNGNLEVVGNVTSNSVQIANVEFTGETTTTMTSVTALGEFLKIKVNGIDRYVRLFSIE